MAFLEVTTKEEMTNYLPEVWALLVEAYARVPGGLHYESPEEVIAKTNVWHLMVLGGKVQAVTLHKSKHGLKLVAMAKSQDSRQELVVLISHALRHGWMELSDQAEKFVIKHCEGHRFIIHSSHARKLLEKNILPSSSDGYHYRRKIMNHHKVKILLGSPSIAVAA